MIEISEFEKKLPALSDKTVEQSTTQQQEQNPALNESSKVVAAKALLYAERFDFATEGERNNAIYANANRLREKFGISEAEGCEILLEYNRRKCNPPLPDNEVRKSVSNAFKYGKKPTGSGYEPNKKGTVPEAWPELIPLAEYDLPDFPVDVLPETLKDFVKDVARSIQVPADLPAMLTLAAVSVVIGGRYEVRAKPDWPEQVNLYVVIVMPSATRKSTVFKLVTEPIQECERELCESLKTEIEKCHSDYRILEARRKKLERELVDGKGGERELDQVNCEIAGFQWIYEPTLIASDVTVEVVSRLLSENEGRLGIYSAEGGIFAIFAGRYADNKPVNDVFLKAHVGDMIKVHRVGRESEYIERPAVSMGLCIQPTILENLGHKRLLQDSGLLARFLYSIPQTRIGTGTFQTPAISNIYRDRYHQLVKRIFRYIHKLDKVQTLKLSPDAVDKFQPFYEEIEKRLAEYGDLQPILAWGGKLRGTVLRIAGILELAKAAEGQIVSTPEISKETIESAIEIGRYCVPHAQASLGQLGMDRDTTIAKRIEGYIKKVQKDVLSTREIFEHTKGAVDIGKVTDIEAPIDLLVRHGYLRPKDLSATKRGRPSTCWEVNPAFFEIYVADLHSQNTQYS
jgi:replicative DNA helicase